MSNTMPLPTAPAGGPSAGTQLRKAREAQRLPIEALAAALKVTPQKLKLLEADRFSELPDPAFARALTQTICRYLKIEPAPVLALLPPATGSRIANLSGGLNEPFREYQAEGFNWRRIAAPAVWGPLLLVLAAAALYLAPPDLLSRLRGPAATSSSSESGATASAGGSSIVTEVLRPPGALEVPAAAPKAAPALPPAAAPAATAPAAALPAEAAPLVQVDATADSWVEVVDGSGRSLLARTVRSGESLRLDGELPLRVKIGNASAVTLQFKGQPVDLVPATRGSVARLRLK